MGPPEYTLAVDEGTSSLLVSGAPEMLRWIGELVQELDQPPPRISVELLVLEISTGESIDLGVDFFLPLSAPKALSDA